MQTVEELPSRLRVTDDDRMFGARIGWADLQADAVPREVVSLVVHGRQTFEERLQRRRERLVRAGHVGEERVAAEAPLHSGDGTCP